LIVIGLALFGLGIMFSMALTPVSGGEILGRLVLADIVNFFLCLLRVMLCWTRYIFYDIQVEGIDIALQYTDESYLSLGGVSFASLFFAALESQLDIVFVGLQTMLSLFKIAIASFLLWLIADLFVMRPASRVASLWLSHSR
jgi:hypothetical protein